MNNKELILTIIILAVSVQITRFLPFAVFQNKENPPKVIGYLGKVLPAAVMGLLCVYCFKDYDYSSFTEVIPAFIAAAAVVITHLIKKNTILSIIVGTAAYMILIRVL